jgi:hypothetical protein
MTATSIIAGSYLGAAATVLHAPTHILVDSDGAAA